MSPAPSFNALADQKSPYLLQHAQQPVHWMPWGEAAFQKARELQRPIFLSIGYSTCHWCHVMAHESFDNPETAALLNEHFVPVKVDREERPDIDRLYMSFVQATTGSGGWPMSVWLTPDLEPFYGGTYFPPENRYGRMGFPTLLKRINEAWKNDREGILKTSRQTIEALRDSSALQPHSGALHSGPMDSAFQTLLRQYDEEEGGFGNAPKFPRPATLHFLFRHAKRVGLDTRDGQIAAAMALHTLRAMTNGGMNDQIGGGFHRYSVDRVWHVPHFEKMLYDQAQLVCAHLEAFQITQSAFHSLAAARTLDYVAREMTDPSGGFHSAEDADSQIKHGSSDHAEGAFYVWEQAEIERALGENARLFIQVYGILPQGNSPQGSDPHGELANKNTLIRKLSPAEAAARSGLSEPQTEALLDQCRQTLLRIRAQRPKPHRDDKILLAWNGLMISAFAKGSAILSRPDYLLHAQRAALFLKNSLRDGEHLLRSHRNGPSPIAAFAEDYAFFIQALLDLWEADFDPGWIEFALQLQKTQNDLFLDPADGAFFSSQSGDPSVLIRMKEDHDGAEPSANSVSANNLLRLSELTNNQGFKTQAEKTLRAFFTNLQQAPIALPQMLCSLDRIDSPPRQVVIVGSPQSHDTRALLNVVNTSFLPNRTLICLAPGEAPSIFPEEIRAMKAIEGRATAYVCENFSCRAPVQEPTELEALLKKRPDLPLQNAPLDLDR